MSHKKKALLIADNNTRVRNHQKAYEELIELSLELIQRINRPYKNNDSEIISEIADVKIRLWYLEDYYGEEEVKKAVNNKLNKLNKNVNIRRHSDKKS
jgi:NTP pyrophosphatase (non-canonical NTP hydrolase)